MGFENFFSSRGSQHYVPKWKYEQCSGNLLTTEVVFKIFQKHIFGYFSPQEKGPSFFQIFKDVCNPKKYPKSY